MYNILSFVTLDSIQSNTPLLIEEGNLKMRFDTDSKPVLSWITDSSKSHSTRKNRKYMLGLYCLANGKTLETVKLHNSETWSTESVVKATNELIEEIRAWQGSYENTVNRKQSTEGTRKGSYEFSSVSLRISSLR